MILRYEKKSFYKQKTTKVWILSIFVNKNDIFQKIIAQQQFDISAAQNLKQSKVKHFPQIKNYDLFQYLKFILRFI